jgi:hypothetical protein
MFVALSLGGSTGAGLADLLGELVDELCSIIKESR